MPSNGTFAVSDPRVNGHPKSVQLGVRKWGHPAGVITGNASVGYRRFQPVSPTIPGYSGVVSTVGVGMTLYGRHHVGTVFSRDVQYSYETANTYYVGTGGTLTWTLSVVGPIDVRAIGGRFVMDYSRTSTNGNDTTTTVHYTVGP